MTMDSPLVSIIMPAYNSSLFITESIESVLEQEYPHLELIIINDGSTDHTGDIVAAFKDSRIRHFSQENKGVSAARNMGLKHMNGEYFCFLDADDKLPSRSIVSRIELFQTSPNVEFVDGVVHKCDSNLRDVISTWKPTRTGNPLEDLLELSGRSFFGLSWMIRRKAEEHYQFRSDLTHGEDLLFFMELARSGGRYVYTEEVIYEYRMHTASAMANLDGLAHGYKTIEKEISAWPEVVDKQINHFRRKYRSFLWKSYLRKFKLIRAFKYVLDL